MLRSGLVLRAQVGGPYFGLFQSPISQLIYGKYNYCTAAEQAVATTQAGGPTPRRKKRKQLSSHRVRVHFVRGILRNFLQRRRELFPVAEVVALYERRVKWHKRVTEWKDNQQFKLERKKEREIQRDFVEGSYKKWQKAKQQDILAKQTTKEELQLDANIQALELLMKADHLWERYPDELQDLKYDIRRASRPYYTKFN